ncbi:uroporphyrinogen-III synthase [Peribacillus simplex]|jgi:uroporphyrinogen-III synthase|uniref:uroporphyrinogen-III synthase n=1 Tax=Peribacillus TaxID=2675229 RepID=UPI000B63CDF6|nr:MULTISPECIES: uroporphyrinogen-III synthase [Peribacillus]MDM5293667.1 uroporphyrinogen-III synthase [Peribacillus simplex]MDV7763428.1 uroporphyrinogen-III synthase [Peribacillus sp. CSMR9]SNS64724.1 uroporphyrinogen-III synthase [Bacillus sp. OK838]
MNPFQPLKDYRVLITRGKGQADGLKDSIDKNGGTPLLVPLLEFTLPDHMEVVQERLDELHTYDWIILTSQNGVDFFFKLIGEQPLMLPKIAVIGSKTEAALKRHGYRADFVPAQFVAEGFVAEFITLLDPGSRVLLAKGNLARAVIAEAINETGASCDEVIIYHTVLPGSSEKRLVKLITNHEIDIITFTSSSTVNHFLQIMERHDLDTYIDRIIIACIGPIAAKTAEKNGLNVDVCPDVYTTDAMVADLIRFISKKK